MAAPSNRILVLGATGVLGKVIVEALLDTKDSWDRIGIFTSPATVESKPDLITSLQARGVNIITGDINNDVEVSKAFNEYDTIISAVGRAAIAKQADLIRIANDLPGVVRFIPSEAGTDIAYDETSAQERPHQQKLRIRALLESEEISNITYTFLVTGPFADLYVGVMADEPQLGSFDIAARRATLLGDGEGRISLTTMTDVGKALVAVLRNPQYCDGKAVKVNSFTTTPHAILAEFERQTQSKWHVDYTPLAELQRREAEAWAAGKPLAGLYTLRRIWTQGATLYAETDNRAIGLTDTENLETVVRAAVAKPSAGYQSTAL